MEKETAHSSEATGLEFSIRQGHALTFSLMWFGQSLNSVNDILKSNITIYFKPFFFCLQLGLLTCLKRVREEAIYSLL